MSPYETLNIYALSNANKSLSLSLTHTHTHIYIYNRHIWYKNKRTQLVSSENFH